ncbi:hypothetical protein [Enterococcus massiliensis]|nr:hypothetical protein [Enterococcus massiliensis]
MELDLEPHSLPVYECLASETRLKILNFIGNRKKVLAKLPNTLV